MSWVWGFRFSGVCAGSNEMVGEAGEVAPWVSLCCGWHFCVWEEEDGELERELRMRVLG